MASNPKSGSRKFAAKYGDALCDFLCEAQLAHLNGKLTPETTAGGMPVVRYAEDDFTFLSYSIGGEPFAGMIVVQMDGEDCFALSYRGRIAPFATNVVENTTAISICLREAMQCMHFRHPWFGPDNFDASNGLTYRNRWGGNLRDISGQATVTTTNPPPGQGKKPLCTIHYMGGIVNKD